MNKSRRKILYTLGVLLPTLSATRMLNAAEILGLNSKAVGNFQYIYGEEAYKKEFFTFLTNVFHLYPEDKMHELISSISNKEETDQAIYNDTYKNLSEIKPFLSNFTHALPALTKQKKVIAEQTTQLLRKQKRFSGYLEVGSNGRYLDSLEEVLEFEGDTFFLNEVMATYSPTDIIDRGQLFKAGTDIELNNYNSSLNKYIPKNSLDLVTVYIGFHHCPLNLREEFITSIRDVMTKDGVLILRDHNAHDEKMLRMVALAHDVFNMGTDQPWSYNDAELRHFYSLIELEKMLLKYGFKSDGRKLYQTGDPTLNALMIYTKA